MSPHPDALAPPPLDPSGEPLPLHLRQLSAHETVPIAPMVDAGPSEAGMLWRKIALAGVSNMTAALVTNPADLIKVRQQLQLKSLSLTTGQTTTRSTNAFRTLVEMVKHEGPLSIYKGLSGSLLRETTYSGIRMGGYDLVKSTICKVNPAADPQGFGTKLAAGMASGMVGAAIANPADLLKVRLQAPSATGSLRWHASQIIQQHGVAGLYKAVFPTTVRAGILTSSQLGVYDHAKHTLINDFPGTFREGLPTHLAASGFAGFCCSATSNPIDVVKVRMMTDSTGQYRSAMHCAALLLKNEGPLAFYKGFSMCFWRLWPHSIVSLLVFEQLRLLVGMKPL
ncbi:hypothetical protein BMF94_4008 [Rhodotorula taiwanensis]|uniref:Uncharacterized protein n=1 Tax=Rhodotorula taiwanensis TaxID=741276 RepID=A0A2S5B832_9BASI|nr:hypothetical protein BMF94_4008 [Rhodotorula taiwanensis]